MKGDFTRFTFTKKKQYNKVMMQQGRVQVDADWNEQIDILDHRYTTFLKDIIGESAAPVNYAGFSIKKGSTAAMDKLRIGKGRYYVDGILIENEEDLDISMQTDYPWFKQDGTTRLIPEIEHGHYIAYLDVWERHVTSLNDPEIQESALGSADTTTRSKIVWQVKLHHLNNEDIPFNPTTEEYDWIPLSEEMQIDTTSKHPIAVIPHPKDDRLVVFGIKSIDSTEDGKIYFTIQKPEDSQAWEPWNPLLKLRNKTFTNIAVGKDEEGMIVVFGIDRDENRIYYSVQKSVDSLSWSNWSSLYSNDEYRFSDMVVGSNKAGYLEIFALGKADTETSDHIYRTAKLPGETEFQKWVIMDNPARPLNLRNIKLGTNKKDHLELVAIRTSDKKPYYIEQLGDTEQTWNEKWSSYSGENKKFYQLAVGNNQKGELKVFGIDYDGKTVFHQTLPDEGDRWTGNWKSLGDSVKFAQIAVCKNQDQILEIFGIGSELDKGNVYKNNQKDVDSEDWQSSWELLNDEEKIDYIEVTNNILENRVEVFGVRTADQVLCRLAKTKRTVNCKIPVPSWDTKLEPSTASLQARARKVKSDDESCMLPPSGGGYRRLENQLYRVEIHDPHGAGEADQVATFKFSRDNGTIVTRIKEISGENLTVANSGKGKLLGFSSGQWVEITDDKRDLYGEPGTIVKLKEPINENNLSLDLASKKGDDITPENYPQEFNPTVRRWDSQEGLTKVYLPADNEGYIPLEDGIEIKFGSDANYFTGDYWLIPARTITADIEWPKIGKEPKFLTRKGIEHHYCRLALIEYTAEDIFIEDCRNFFFPLTETSTITGKISIKFVFNEGDGEIKKQLISPPFEHGMNVGVPPAVILEIENPENDKEFAGMGSQVMYKSPESKLYRFTAVNIDLKTFRIKATNMDNSKGQLKMNFLFLANPVTEINPQDGKEVR